MSNFIRYKNGNYTVALDLETGTKIRYNDLDTMVPDTIENFDLKITSKCNMGCPFCFENSTVNGTHADLSFAGTFLETLHPYTEIAIGGGNPLEHPDLYKFLVQCQEHQFIPSMTVNQIHFEENYDFIMKLINEKLIYGLGVSLVNPTLEFINKIKRIPNAVIHVINGVVEEKTLIKLSDLGLKILILGYKVFRRGEELYTKDSLAIESKKEMLKNLIPTIIKENWFEVVSFDNLALKQLDIKSVISEKEWDNFYMGDDGVDGDMNSASMFIDLVERKFARNSCATERFDLMPTVEEMYNYLRGIK